MRNIINRIVSIYLISLIHLLLLPVSVMSQPTYEAELSEGQRLVKEFKERTSNPNTPRQELVKKTFEIFQSQQAKQILKGSEKSLGKIYNDIVYVGNDSIVSKLISSTKNKLSNFPPEVLNRLTSVRNKASIASGSAPMDLDIGLITGGNKELERELLKKLGGVDGVKKFEEALQKALIESFIEIAAEAGVTNVNAGKLDITGTTPWNEEAYGQSRVLQGDAPDAQHAQQAGDVTKSKVDKEAKAAADGIKSKESAWQEAARGTLKDRAKMENAFNEIYVQTGKRPGWTGEQKKIWEYLELIGRESISGEEIRRINAEIEKLTGGKDVFGACKQLADAIEAAWKSKPVLRLTPGQFIELLITNKDGTQRRVLIDDQIKMRREGEADLKAFQTLKEIISKPRGNDFISKMLASKTAKNLMNHAVMFAPMALMNMFVQYETGQMNDIHDLAVALIQVVPFENGFQLMYVGDKSITDKEVLNAFLSEGFFWGLAAYCPTCAPILIAGVVGEMGWTLAKFSADSVRLQNYHSGLVDLLAYNGEFPEGKFEKLVLPDKQVIERWDMRRFLFETKAVKIKIAVPDWGVIINNLSEKTEEVYSKYYLANDPAMSQLKDASAQLEKNAGCSKNSTEKYCRVYDLIQRQMEMRRQEVIDAVMIPHLIRLAEEKYGTLHAPEELKDKLDKLQAELETLRGSSLDLTLSEEVSERAEKEAEKKDIGEEKKLARGEYWQKAYKAYVDIYSQSKDIKKNIADKTGYEHTQILGFKWTGDYADDLRKAEQSKKGFASELSKITRDINKAKGSAPDPSDTVDREAFDILANVVFPERAILDELDRETPAKGSTYFAEYKEALQKVNDLYGKNAEFQARLDKGAQIIKEKETLLLNESSGFKLSFMDEALAKDYGNGVLKIRWVSEPSGTFRPDSKSRDIKFTAFSPEPVTITVTIEKSGVNKSEGSLNVVVPVRKDKETERDAAGSKPEGDGDKKSAPTAQVQPDSYTKGFGDKDTEDAPSEVQHPSDEIISEKGPVQTPGDEKTGPVPGPKDETEIKGETEGKAGAGDDKKTADDQKTADEDKQFDDRKTDVKEPPACSYEYTDWGECSRETKKQTRSVSSIKPESCIEKDKPALEQGCTPPPTEEEKRQSFLSCLCRSCGGSMGGYYNTGDSCDSARPCACWGVFNCWSTPIPTGDELVKSCYSSAYGIKDPDKDELNKAVTGVKEENRKHMKPLKAKLNREDCPIHAQLGDVLNFSLSFEGGLPPHTVSWSGEGEAKDNAFIFAKSRQPGSHTISATVNDGDGNSATVSCTVIVDVITVKIEKTSPAEDTLPIGSQASFKAIVMSGSGQAGGELKFLWQPHPEVQFGDDKSPRFETTSPTTTATYTKIGTFPMWVQVLKKMGETYQTVGESDQILMTIAKPKFKLTADNKAPKVGDTVVLTVHEEPKMSDDMISFWWEIQGNAENPGPAANIPNSRAYSFKPKDAKPVTVTVHAKTKDGENDLGEEKATITAISYNVTVTGPKSAGPKPQVWKEGVGLVDVEREIAVHQRVEFGAEVSPKPETDLRYNWIVSGGSCTLSNPIVKDVGVTCSETGSYEIAVTIRDKDGIELGRGAGNLSVTISQDQLDKAAAKAKPKVSLKADKSVLTVGETANVTASIDGGKPPYNYKWTGDFEGQGESIRFGPKKPGSHTLAIEIADAKGNKDSANITFKVEAIKVTIEGLQNEVVYGTKLNLSAKPEDYRIAWKSEPAITFTPRQGPGGKTTASFGSIGKVRIWAAAQHKTGEVMGESDKKEINVIAPEFEITFTPPKGKLGDEVKATIKTIPPIDKSLVKFVWISPQPPNIKTYDTNIIGFTPKSTVPVEFLALAKEPVRNGTLAEITGRYTAEAVKLDVYLKADKARLKIGGTANVKATVKGGKTPYTFTWKGDYTGHGPSMRFIAQESGPQKLSVEVTDALGNKGSADISLDVDKATTAKSADAKSNGAKSTDVKSADKGPVKTAPLPESFTTPKTSDSSSSGYDVTKDPSFKAGKKPTGVTEVYDPTKDPNVKGSGKQVDIAAVDKAGKDFQDKSWGTKKTGEKGGESQVTAQPDTYTGEGKPDEGKEQKTSSTPYPPYGHGDATGFSGKNWTDITSGKSDSGKDWGGSGGSPVKDTASKSTTSAASGTSTTSATSTASSAPALTAIYENKSDAPVHIFAEGDSFGPNNRLAPGEKRTVSLKMPPDGRIKFISGRNGQIISAKYWNGDPGDLNRYPMVRFVKGMGGKEELLITTNLK